MSGEIDALYIYDEHNAPLVEHVYRSRPPSAASIIPFYLAHPAPRPSLLYLPNATPPVTIFSVVHAKLLLLAVSEVDTEPLLALEFLHRVIDALEEFVGAPLLSTKIQTSYDVVAQLLHEVCDAGVICNTEQNALQEVVEVPGWMGKLLGGVGLPGSSTPTLGASNPLKQSLAAASLASGPAIPWRRPGVRHTSNELYVDIVESLSVVIAPSGRLLSALASGTIACTSKISGIPDLLLSLSTPGGQQAIARKLELPVFHPCVRLARWRERPGELSFVPPDGRFILAGYEVDLLPIDPDLDHSPTHMEKVFLPAIVDIRKTLGPTGSDFEVRLTLNTNFPRHLTSSTRSGPGRSGSGASTPSFLGGAVGGGGGGGSSSAPTLEEVVVTVPISKDVRNVTDMQASRGEAYYQPGSEFLEWRVPTGKDAGSVSGTATLRCTVAPHMSAVAAVDEDELDEGVDEALEANANLLQGYYDAPTSYQEGDAAMPTERRKRKTKKKKKVKKSRTAVTVGAAEDNKPGSPALDPESQNESQAQVGTQSEDPTTSSPPEARIHQLQPQHSPASPPSPSATATTAPASAPVPTTTTTTTAPPSIFRPPARKTRAQIMASLMPNSASVSFSVRGWLPSGIRVESLTIDPRRSRGLGEGVKPYKGVKYLCVSRRGVERRC